MYEAKWLEPEEFRSKANVDQKLDEKIAKEEVY